MEREICFCYSNIGFAVRCNIEKPPNLNQVKILCFNGNIKKCAVSNDEQCAFDNYDALVEQLKEQDDKETIKFIEAMQMDGVKVVFCSGQIDKFCREKFAEDNTVLIENIERDHLHRIAELTNGPKMLLHRLSQYETSFTSAACDIVYEPMKLFDTDGLLCICNANTQKL